MIDWPICLTKAILGISAILLFTALAGCASRLCHPDDGSCYASPRSMALMSADQLVRELSKK